jgi:hypothetical protein
MVTFNPKALWITAAVMLALLVSIDSKLTSLGIVLHGLLTLGGLFMWSPATPPMESLTTESN